MNKTNITRCANIKCQTSETPLWRKGWQLPSGKRVRLCNACGLHYKKNHFCPYCNQVYRESEADDLENPWIGCDTCQRWVHRHCEETQGDKEYLDNSQTYNCPDCRNRNQQQNKETTNVPSPNSPSRKRKASQEATFSLPPKKRPRKEAGISSWTSQKPTLTLQASQVLSRKRKNNYNNGGHSITLPSFKYLAANIPEKSSNYNTSITNNMKPSDWGLSLLSPYKYQPTSENEVKIDREAVLRQLQKFQKKSSSFATPPSNFDCLCAVCETERE